MTKTQRRILVDNVSVAILDIAHYGGSTARLSDAIEWLIDALESDRAKADAGELERVTAERS
jgi:hypothetical protein